MNNREKNTYVRRQLLQALLAMMECQDFSSISIRALTEKACVGRASFYRNFTGKEDILRQESDRLMREWEQEWARAAASSPDAFVEMLLNFYTEHAAFYRLVYKAGLSEIILQTLLRGAGITPELPNAEAYLRSAMAYLIYGWVIEWIRRGMQESGTELMRMIAKAREEEALRQAGQPC